MALEAWVQATLPAQVGRVRPLVAECLDHFRGEGRIKADWKATCRNWIRKDLTIRQERGASGRGGNGALPRLAPPLPAGVPQWHPNMPAEEKTEFSRWMNDAEDRRAKRMEQGFRR